MTWHDTMFLPRAKRVHVEPLYGPPSPLSLSLSLNLSQTIRRGFLVLQATRRQMEQQETHRPEPPGDSAMVAGCGAELTRTDSDTASSVTVSPHGNTNGQYATWTDEKHNSYLDALEASFVEQLQKSLGSKKRRFAAALSRATINNADYPSDQFAVLQGGFWRRKTFEKARLLPYSAADSHFALKSSRLCHLLASEKLSNVHSTDSTGNILGSDKLQSSEKKLLSHKFMSSRCPLSCHLGYQDTVGTLAEGSDQNFVDEDQVEKTNSFSRVKGLKKVAAYVSPEEQIVPSRDILVEEISTSRNPLSEVEEHVLQENVGKHIEKLLHTM